MSQPDKEISPVKKAVGAACILSVIPALLVFAHLRDDSAAIAAAKAERIAAQENKYRQIMYDEIDRRLGNAR